MVTSAIDTTPGPPARASNQGSEPVCARLVDAAIHEFAAYGFDGASTRAIAVRAETHQPQINYHFGSKEALWKAAIERLLGELDVAISVEVDDPRVVFETVVRGFVRFAAARPELNRIMMHEATAPGARLTWLVETHVEVRFEALKTLWNLLYDQGECAAIEADLVYHVLVGAASLLYANAPEARLLMAVDPSDPAVVEAHADALIAMFLVQPQLG